ncbi:MAG TPA: HD domain-containing phosphohydrolase [Coriobacteriia bacterium]|nr:HD domain-containing phosphohydrolase [Coriobacteriia bacterium]
MSEGPTGRAVDVAEVLGRLASDASVHFTVVGAHLWLFDETTRTMRMIAATGEMTPATEPVDVDHSSVGEPILTARACLSAPSDHDGVGAWRYAVPVAASDVSGVFALDILSTHPDEAKLISVAASHRQMIAAALIAYAANEDRRLASVTLEWACRIVRVLDRKALLDELVVAALEIGQGEKGSVLLLDPADNALKIVASRGLPESVVTSTRVVPGDGMAGWVYATGEPLVIEDLEDRGARGRRHGVRSAVVVPIVDEDSTLGVINVGSSTFKATFSDSRLNALKALGRAAAVALRNAEALGTSHDLLLDTVRALALALETKDPYAYGATQRVFDLAARLGTAMALPEHDLVALKAGALLHDIGMSAAAEDATRRDRPLDTYEWGMLKMHPVIAADVLKESTALRDAIPVIYHHHEHYDGGGYMQGIAGDKIPLGARILAVADAYVAMTSPRAYRDAMTHEEAIAELQDHAGTQFDPAVVDLAVTVFAEVTQLG